MGRIGQPEEVAKAALFLASDDFLVRHRDAAVRRRRLDGALMAEEAHPAADRRLRARRLYLPGRCLPTDRRAAGATGSKPSSVPRARR